MIKFIYFDVGGVLVKDFSCTNSWQELKRGIGIKSEQDAAFDKFFNVYESQVCVGKDIETLLPLIAKEFGLSFSDEYSFLKEYVDRFEKNESIVPVIASIRRGIGLGLLTNMYPGMLRAITDKNLIPKVNWDVVIDSSVEHVLKPQRRIFELAQERAGFAPNQILFVENSHPHVAAAKEAGWHTFLYDSSDYIKSSQDLMGEISDLTKNA